jgi:hypothetical protein
MNVEMRGYPDNIEIYKVVLMIGKSARFRLAIHRST